MKSKRAGKIVKSLIFASIAGLALIGLASCSGGGDTMVSVTTVGVESGTINKEVTVSGVLAPDSTANVFSRVSGIAKSVNADIGSKVKKSQILVEIDTKELNAQRDVARAAVESVKAQGSQAKLGIDSAQSNLDAAQKNFDRISALFKTQAASQGQLDDATTKLDLAKTALDNAQHQYENLTGAGLAQAEAQENLIEVQVDNGVIRAPISGIVSNRNINAGEVVSMAAPLMTIVDTSTLKLQGNVTQDTVLSVALGQKAAVRIDGIADRTFNGTVSQIGPVGASTGQYFPLVISLPSSGVLLAGMTASATLSFKSGTGLIVPASAIKTISGNSYVFVVDGGSVHMVAVHLGMGNADQVQISGDVHQGESVASSNVDLLSDGAKVRRTE